MGESAWDGFGISVSLSSDGNTLAVGADGNDYSGQVKVYRVNSSNKWIQLGSDIDGESAGDYFGSSVSLSSDGKTLAVGAWGNDENGYTSGELQVYRINTSNK